MSSESLPSLNSSTGSTKHHSHHHHHHHGSGGGGSGNNAEDDLNDLMEVFDDFDVFDDDHHDEAQALERAIGREYHHHTANQNGNTPSLFPHVVNGASSSSSALQQPRKQANGSPMQVGHKEIGGFAPPPPPPPPPQSMEIEHSGSAKKKTSPPKTKSPATGAATAGADTSSPSTPLVVKQKRGRKKKEEVLANAAAAAAVAGIPFVHPALGSKAGKESPSSMLAGGGSEEEKERLRRENNKQSARNSRKKKKEYVLVLSESIASLTKEVQDLRGELAKKATEDDRREKLACIGRSAFVQALELHGPNSSRRKVSAIYQFENLTRNVAPPHTRFLLWSVARKATEADSAAARTWQEVSSVIGLQPEQQDRFAVLMRSKKATDNAAAEERDRLQFVFNSIQKLRSGMEHSSAKLAEYQSALLEILSPVQQALLFQWIEETQSEQNATAKVRSFAFGTEPLAPEMARAKSTIMATTTPTSRSASHHEESNAIDFLLSLK